jgi:PAS domain-containing protein
MASSTRAAMTLALVALCAAVAADAIAAQLNAPAWTTALLRLGVLLALLVPAAQIFVLRPIDRTMSQRSARRHEAGPAPERDPRQDGGRLPPPGEDWTDKLRSIFDDELDGKLVLDRHGAILYVNPAAELLMGRMGARLLDEPFGLPLVRGRFTEIELLHCGEPLTVEMHATQIQWKGQDAYHVSLHDITRRKQAEAKIRRLNGLYAALSGLNSRIVRERNPQTLFDEVCRLAVRQGGLRRASVGLLYEDGIGVSPVARAASEGGEGDGGGREPDPAPLLQRVLADKKPLILNDVSEDPDASGWREAGCRSLGMFPMFHGRDVAGIVFLQAGEKDFFDVEEAALLSEIAVNLSYAMERVWVTSRPRPRSEGEADRP